jgi:hypothetical protein
VLVYILQAMKFTSLTIDQFQRIAAIEATGEASLKKVAITAVIKNITLEEAKQLPMTEVNAEYNAIEAELKNLPELRFKQSIRLNKKRYHLSLYTDTLSAGQLLELMSFNMTDEYEIIQNLHKVMATLARERKWFRTLAYDGAKHNERAEAFKSLTMGDVWGAVSFFLLASDSFLTIMKEYSGAQLKKMVKGLA